MYLSYWFFYSPFQTNLGYFNTLKVYIIGFAGRKIDAFLDLKECTTIKDLWWKCQGILLQYTFFMISNIHNQLELFSLLSYISNVLTWIFPILQNSFTSFNKNAYITFFVLVKKLDLASDRSWIKEKNVLSKFEDDCNKNSWVSQWHE